MNPHPWNLDTLSQTPTIYPAPGLGVEGLQALFFDAIPWQGKPTRTFAYLGIPESSGNRKVPGIVLVHGGDGTAFANWVKLWLSRGYAAIAMDTCGNVPCNDLSEGSKSIPRPQRHDLGGPAGWGGFDQVDKSEKDQWPYHAVANVLLAHSLLRTQPDVDPNRIGITGISWGGFLTCISAGIDSRFRFAAPVYGCGFLGDNSMWLPDFTRMGKRASTRWLQLWDPSNYLVEAQMPFLWLTGTNDPAYPLDSFRKSYSLPPAPRTLSVSVRMPHGHGGPGENPEEIRVFADAILKNGTPLVQIVSQKFENDVLQVVFESSIFLVKAELNYTRDSGPWVDRFWETRPADIDLIAREVRVTVSRETTVFYLNLTDERSVVVSSDIFDQSEGKL